MVPAGLTRKRYIGAAFCVVLMVLVVSCGRLTEPAMGGDGPDAMNTPTEHCFQGFCIEVGEEQAGDGTGSPIVASVDPDIRGSLGVYAVSVFGHNFQEGAEVTFGGEPATRVQFRGPQLLVATSPKHPPGVVDVAVINPDGGSGELELSYTYLGGSSPIVASINPSSGRLGGGTVVTILGSNFATGATVTFGGVRATGVVVEGAGTIRAATPSHAAGDVEVAVTNPDSESGTRATAFSYQAPTFIDATTGAGLTFIHERRPDIMPFGGGLVVLDADGDRLPDIYAANSAGPNALYRNAGDGTFVDIAEAAGVSDPAGQGNGGCAADFDNDGDHDLFATNWGSSRLFENDGLGRFVDVTTRARVGDLSPSERSMGCAWGDYDLDGDVDLIVVRHVDDSDLLAFQTRRFESAVKRLALYQNNSDGTFDDATALLGAVEPPIDIREDGISAIYGAGFQPVWVDIDNDGDPDLYVCNDFGDEIQPNRLWVNDGDGTFTDVSEASGANLQMSCMGVAVGDYDADGFLDLYLTNVGDNVLLRNLGSSNPHTFADTAPLAGATIGSVGGAFVFDGRLLRQLRVTWGDAFFDLDNDGDEDLYVVAGHLDTDPDTNALDQPNVLLRNDANERFTDVSDNSGAEDAGIGRGLATLDFNGDGCLDLVLSNFEGELKLLQNRCVTGNSWLSVTTVGVASNRGGIGARISAVTGETVQIREITAGSSQMSQSALAAHFGLGSASIIDSLIIRWPSGTVQVLTDVPVNQTMTVIEPAGETAGAMSKERRPR